MNQNHSHSIQLDPAYMRQLFHSGNRKEFLAAVQLALRQILIKLNVENHYDQVIAQMKREVIYRDLNNTWEGLKPAARGQKWQELLERLVQIAYATRPYCLRCGECCRLGSPSLHLEDADLLAQGLISTQQIYTLRRGEPVRFNIEGRLGLLPAEVIKIKQDPMNHHCMFYSEEQKNCSIYQHRPLQCRVQECWNAEALERLWRQEKLTRRDLLQDDQESLDLLELHDERCELEKIDEAFAQLHESGDLKILTLVLDILRQDTAIRAFVKQKLNREDEELDFLLGRPLIEIVRLYGVRVEKDEDNVYHLVPDR